MKTNCAICDCVIEEDDNPVCVCNECLRQIDCCFGDREHNILGRKKK